MKVIKTAYTAHQGIISDFNQAYGYGSIFPVFGSASGSTKKAKRKKVQKAHKHFSDF